MNVVDTKTFALLFALLLVVPAGAQSDPWLPDTVRVGCPINIGLPRPDSIAIPIYIWADDTLQGFTLGFEHNSPYLTVSSVSREGSVIPGGWSWSTNVPNGNQVLFGAIDLFAPAAVNPVGLLATINLQVDPDAPVSVADIDSTFIPPAGSFTLTLSTGGITPEYRDCGTEDIVFGQDEVNDPDTIIVGCPVVLSYPCPDSVAIPIYIWADDSVSSFSLGFEQDSPYLTMSSVDTTGTVIPGGWNWSFSVPSNNLAWFSGSQGAGPAAVYPVGLIATVYLQVYPYTPESVVDFDSTFVPPAGAFTLTTESGPVTPRFRDCGTDDILIFGCDTSVTFDIFSTAATLIYNLQAIDLDHDNNSDLVFSSFIDTMGVYIAYGRGDGSFEPVETYLRGSGLAFDFAFVDGDSLMDIVILSHDQITSMLNRGGRTFDTVVRPYSNESDLAIAAGFFNDDNIIDIAVAPNAIYLGNGSGGFISYSPLPTSFLSVDVSEFNGDGHDDLIIATHYSLADDSLVVLLNNGHGNFTRSWAMSLGQQSSWSVTTAQTLADFDQDGNRDFAALDPPVPPLSGSTLLIGLGDGSGGVREVKSVQVDGIAYKVSAADLDRDHHLDLVVADGGDREAEIYFGDGTGNFSTPLIVDPMTSCVLWNVSTADFDRDGNPDLVLGGFNSDPDSGRYFIAINLLEDEPVLADEMVTSGYGPVSVGILNPDSFAISRDFITVAGADYWRYNLDSDSIRDESTVDYNLQYGEYLIQISPRPGADPGATFGIGIGIDGSQQRVIFHNYSLPTMKVGGRPAGYLFYYTVEDPSSIQPPNGLAQYINPPTCDWSGLAPAGTFDFQLDRFFDFSGPDLISVSGLSQSSYSLSEPLGRDSVFYWHFRQTGESGWSRTFALYMAGYACGDADANEIVNIADAVYLISYIFGGGTAPDPQIAGDADCNEIVNIADAVYLIGYIFGGGPVPCAACP